MADFCFFLFLCLSGFVPSLYHSMGKGRGVIMKSFFLQKTVKMWAQYELIDQKIVEKIIDSLELQPDDTVLEIGAGTGVLTIPIKEKVKRLIAVEIDKGLSKKLQSHGIEVVNMDFLEVDITDFPPSTKIVSNLPYYITTPIITKVIDKFDFMVMLMQEEVAKRLTGNPGTKEYGAVSVLVQFYTAPQIICSVSRKCFKPVPDVDSCLVRFRKRETKVNVPVKFLFRVVHAGFGSRRKMLKNTLKGFANLGNVSIDLSRRAETLSVLEFCKLAEELWR